jgi:TonB family protein
MTIRASIVISLMGASALAALCGCAATPSHAPNADLYATDGGEPADIYHSWHLYKEMDGEGSVAGELRLADLTRWSRDGYRSAYYWYRKAAAEGDGVAAANLWYMYTTAPAGTRSESVAMGYYQLASESEAGARQLLALQTKAAIDSARPHAGPGTVLVEFDRGDGGKAEDVKVYCSSGQADLDQAAIEAVQNASLPSLPPNMSGLRHFVISVRFDAGSG